MKKKKSSANTLFDRVVLEVIKEMPPDLRQALATVQVVVQERPSPALLKRVGMEKGSDLFGLFDGLSLRDWPLGAERNFPDRVILFKQSLSRSFPRKKDLAREIRTTLIHELGHYFGFSEKELQKKGWG